MATRVARVALAVWGVRTTLGSLRRRSATVESAAMLGSPSKTSSPAPAMRCDSSASTNAASSIIGPRAVLMRNAVGFIIASEAASMRCVVDGRRGTWRLTMSASASSASFDLYSALKSVSNFGFCLMSL